MLSAINIGMISIRNKKWNDFAPIAISQRINDAFRNNNKYYYPAIECLHCFKKPNWLIDVTWWVDKTEVSNRMSSFF